MIADEIKKCANKKQAIKQKVIGAGTLARYLVCVREREKLIGSNAFNIIRGNNNKFTLNIKSESKNQCI